MANMSDSQLLKWDSQHKLGHNMSVLALPLLNGSPQPHLHCAIHTQTQASKRVCVEIYGEEKNPVYMVWGQDYLIESLVLQLVSKRKAT